MTPTSGSNDNISVGFFAENSGDNNQLIITEAKFVIRKLVLEKEQGEDECDVKMGPFVVNLDLDPRVAVAALNKIPYGNYDAIKFQVHKPSPNENVGDPDFNESTSSRFSVVVRGIYNNEPFVYKSHVTVEKRIEFETHSLTVVSTVINVTIRLNPYSWFTENGNIMDPRVESNHHEIDQNIKQSLRRAFRDINLDGNPD